MLLKRSQTRTMFKMNDRGGIAKNLRFGSRIVFIFPLSPVILI